MTEENTIISINDLNFHDEVQQSKQPVLVIFETDWFGVAHILAPVMKYLAVKYQGIVKVGKFNIDENQLIPKKYGISDMIAILLFKNGELKHQILAWSTGKR